LSITTIALPLSADFIRFKKKSSWIPKPSKNTTLESFIDLVKNDVQTATSTNIPTHNNLTPAEKGALQELKERDDIVIKSADKGSAIVVMDKVSKVEIDEFGDFFCGVPIC
jgi:hypothetical protein